MRPWGFVTAGVLLAIGCVTAWLGHVEGVRVASFSIDNEAGEALRACLYRPHQDEPRPGVLLCHGIQNSKESMEPLALAFVQRGFVVLTIDFGDHGESYARSITHAANVADARRALAALAERPEVDRQRLAVLGFSMGALPAVIAASEDPGVQATVALGWAVTAPKSPPCNLLLGGGFFDQYITPDRFLDALRSSTRTPDAVAGEVYGSFADGTARKLVLSPETDHPLELCTPVLMAESVAWVEEALGQQPNSASMPLTWLPRVSRVTMMLGALVLGVLLVHRGLQSISDEQRRSPWFRRGFALSGAVICLVPVVLSQLGIGSGLVLSDVGIVAVLILVGSNLLLCRNAEAAQSTVPWPEMPRRVFLPVLVMIVTVLAAWVLALVLYRIGYIWNQPSALLSLPRLAGFVFSLYLDIALHKLRMLFFTEYSLLVTPALAWYLLLLVEVLIPGVLLSVALETIESGWRWLQRRRKDALRQGPAAKTSWRTILVRIGLLVAVVIAATLGALRTHGFDAPQVQAMVVTTSGFGAILAVVLLAIIRLTRLPRPY